MEQDRITQEASARSPAPGAATPIAKRPPGRGANVLAPSLASSTTTAFPPGLDALILRCLPTGSKP